MRKQGSGDRHKSAIRFAYRQNGTSRGQFLGEIGRRQTRTRVRSCPRFGKIPSVEERKVRRRRAIKWSHIDDASGMRRRDGRSTGQRTNLLKRETGGVPQERR